MFLKQIIEFELTGSGSPGRTYVTKQKSIRNIFVIAGGNVPYFPPSGPNHEQNLTLKCNILNVYWT